MRVDGEATRERILFAAAKEFAEFGLAGARVDRIALAASASKERLYAYFGDKRALFVAVLEAHTEDVVRSIPMTAEDLPGFVGAVFDFSHDHPEHFRMMDWARLGGDFDLLPEIPAAIIERDTREIRDAQDRGVIDGEWSPEELFALLFAIATASSRVAISNASADNSPETRARRRASAVRAAAKLLAP